MKRFFIALTAAAVFAGCSVNGAATSGDDIIQGMYDHTIGAKFDAFAKMVRSQPDRFDQDINLYGEFVEPGTVLEYDVNMNSKGDFLSTIPKFITTVDVMAEGVMDGEVLMAEVEGSMIGLGEEFFASLKTAKGEPLEMFADVAPYVGEWYTTAHPAIAGMLTMNGSEYNEQVLAEMETLVDALNVWETANFSRTGSYYTFDVMLSEAKVRNLGAAAMDFQIAMLDMDHITVEEDKAFMRDMYTMMKEEIMTMDMSDMPVVKGNMKVRRNNWANFELTGSISAMDTDYDFNEETGEMIVTENGMQEVVTFAVAHKPGFFSLRAYEVDGDGMAMCLLENQKYSCAVDGEVVFSGEKTDSAMTLTMTEEDFSFGYERDSRTGAYSGFVMVDDVVVRVNEFRIAEGGRKVNFKMSVEDQDMMFTLNLDTRVRSLRSQLLLNPPAFATPMSEEVEMMLDMFAMPISNPLFGAAFVGVDDFSMDMDEEMYYEDEMVEAMPAPAMDLAYPSY